MIDWLGVPHKVRVKGRVEVRVKLRVMVSVACENTSSRSSNGWAAK